MKIEKYNAARLKDFLISERYAHMPYVPVSRHRAESWLNNPRLEADDILMYLAMEGEDMIAYRCILPDRFGEIRYGWLSGNWVRPDLRRRGIASRLFDEAYVDWGHQLMFTNYAPESKAVYDKSGRFKLYAERSGLRYYLRSTAARLLGNRRTLYRRSRPLLNLADGFLNSVQALRILLKPGSLRELNVEENTRLDLEAVGFLEETDGTGFSGREQDDFDWIAAYPWVMEGRDKDDRYFFSSVSVKFRNLCLKVRNIEGRIIGLLWMVVHGDQMTLPYAAFLPEAESGISDLINHYMQHCRVAYMTTYQPAILKIYRSGPILHRRKMVQRYFATGDLARQLPEASGIRFQDGDGDVVFV
jgi:hypothetical protein